MLKELMLGPPGLTLAVAESATGGCVQARITAISGSSAFFRGGITAYHLDSKAKLLGVDPVAAAAVHSVSPAVARQMARGACTLFGADIGLATTGFAEPALELGEKVPRILWAICHRLPDNAEAWREGERGFGGEARSDVQATAADELVAALEGYLAEWRAGR